MFCELSQMLSKEKVAAKAYKEMTWPLEPFTRANLPTMLRCSLHGKRMDQFRELLIAELQISQTPKTRKTVSYADEILDRSGHMRDFFKIDLKTYLHQMRVTLRDI